MPVSYTHLVGGAVVIINESTQHNHLDLLFVKNGVQSNGIGKKIWFELERIYPNTKVWETCTPYFDNRFKEQMIPIYMFFFLGEMCIRDRCKFLLQILLFQGSLSEIRYMVYNSRSTKICLLYTSDRGDC